MVLVGFIDHAISIQTTISCNLLLLAGWECSKQEIHEILIKTDREFVWNFTQ